MKKYILLLVAGLFSMASFAHNPDVSTVVLAEKENNVWVLQISASLTSFQQEVRTHFSDTPYKSPEEFQEMVLQHVKNNLQMYFNGSENVTLGNGVVKLGHETSVVFEVFGIPSSINSVIIKNTVFEDIHKSQSAVIFLKEGYQKKHFVLNNTNNYTLALQVNGNEFVEVVEQKATLVSPISIVGIIGLLGMGILIQNIYKRRKMRLLEVR